MDNKKEPEIIGLFSVFKLLHLHLKENENFKPKFPKPQPILIKERIFPSGGYPQPILFLLVIGDPTV